MITKVGALHDPRSTAKLIVGGPFWFYGRKGFYSLMQFTRSIMATDLTRGVEERGAGENGSAIRTVASAQALADTAARPCWLAEQ